MSTVFHWLARVWAGFRSRVVVTERRPLGVWLVPLVSTPVLYALLYLIDRQIVPQFARPQHLALDLGLQLALAFLLLAFSRRVAPFVILQLLVMAFIYLGNALKLAYFGSPLRTEDAAASLDLIRILPARYMVLLVGAVVAVVMLGVLNFAFRPTVSAIAGAGLAMAAVAFVVAPGALVTRFDAFFKASPWDRAENLRLLGSTAFTLRELALYRASRPTVPSRGEVGAVLGQRQMSPPAPLLPGGRRNVYVILAESFWDPTVLGARFSVDPIDPQLRALLQAGGDAVALSPVTAGQTAEVELELLCGMPAVGGGVKFETTLRNDVPCLPRLLRDQGYYAVAMHPNFPAFWNRRRAYSHLGFERFVSRGDFELDDMNGDCLSDTSLLRQVRAYIEEGRDGRPVFAFIVTYTGHWPYVLAPTRPPTVKAESAVPQLEAYASSVYYSSREYFAFIDELRSTDPEALVLLLGDHPPFLGPGFAAYVEAGLVPAALAAFDGSSFVSVLATPLLLLDRGRTVTTGDRAMFELAPVLLAGAGQASPPWMRAFQPPPGLLVRPVNEGERVLGIGPTGEAELCRPGSASQVCEPARGWTAGCDVLVRDLLAGKQYALEAQGAPETAARQSVLAPGPGRVVRMRAGGTGPSASSPEATSAAAHGLQAVAIAGDWDGNGTDTVGIFRSGRFFLRNSNTEGTPDVKAILGDSGDVPVVGDWDGDGTDTIGVFRSGTFFLRNTNTSGAADITLAFGLPGDQPLAGDWDGDGVDELGVYRAGTFFLQRDSNDVISFEFGTAGDVALAGRWAGRRFDTVGVFRPSTGEVHLRYKNETGDPDLVIAYGLPGDEPIAGDWDGVEEGGVGVFRDGKFYLKESSTGGVADLIFGLNLDARPTGAGAGSVGTPQTPPR